jgi:hypothetical protein
VDANFAIDLDDRKSTTGFVFLVHGGAVATGSKKQPSVATSTVEAEYLAASVATSTVEAEYLAASVATSTVEAEYLAASVHVAASKRHLLRRQLGQCSAERRDHNRRMAGIQPSIKRVQMAGSTQRSGGTRAVKVRVYTEIRRDSGHRDPKGSSS